MNWHRSVGRVASVVGATALTVATAMAQGPGPGGPPGGGPGQGPGPGGFGPGGFLGPVAFKAADINKDGKLSPDEASTAAAKFVRDADTKKAGSIDGATLGRAINTLIPQPDLGGGGDGPPPEDFGPGSFFGPMILQAADADKDGKLSPEEASKAAESFVRDADKDRKGSIEAEALAQAMNSKMGPPGGGPGRPGGPGGMMGGERAIVKDHDKDGDGRLNKQERKEAREAVKKGGSRGGFRMGPPPGMFGKDEPGTPGPKVDRESAPSFAGKRLYDPTVLRTFFLDFDSPDWEAEMADFNDTDVDLPANLTVDGKSYPNVGVHFRGLSSFMAVSAGSKRSLNIAMDYADPKQKLGDYKTLNLLNAHEDNTFLHTVLYFHIARNYLPAPRANFVKLVINGESWGVYVNAQQFDKQFLSENFSDTKGTRWKVPGNPGARGGLEYQGDDPAPYKQRFSIKSGDNPKAWEKLVKLCKVLNETPADKLEEALKPILDIDGALWFLALDNALINNDGYWVRSSDYSIYLDSAGKFHILPHDANETFGTAMMMGFGGGGGGRPGGGPGGFGGPGGGPGGPGAQAGRPGGPGGPGGGPGGPGARPGGMGGPGGGIGMELDPLIGINDTSKPLRSKLLAVPALRQKYLAHVRTIARDWLSWEKLGPVVAQYRSVIDDEIAADTRKLMSNESYKRAVGEDSKGVAPPGRPTTTLRDFAEKRGKYLLNHPEIKKLPDDAR